MMQHEQYCHYLSFGFDPQTAMSFWYLKKKCERDVKEWEQKHPKVKNFPPIFFNILKHRFEWVPIGESVMEKYTELVNQIVRENLEQRRIFNKVNQSR